ncbi:hypothetical protein THAOC_24670, partial [Thalassiosira oceanica]
VRSDCKDLQRSETAEAEAQQRSQSGRGRHQSRGRLLQDSDEGRIRADNAGKRAQDPETKRKGKEEAGTAHDDMQSLSPPGTGPATLKSAQLAAVDSMLSLPSSSDRNGDASSPWKILVYDRHTRGIISPLLSVSALRERGVTLHLLLGSEREPIPADPGEPRPHRPGLLPLAVPVRPPPLQHPDRPAGHGGVRPARRQHRRTRRGGERARPARRVRLPRAPALQPQRPEELRPLQQPGRDRGGHGEGHGRGGRGSVQRGGDAGGRAGDTVSEGRGAGDGVEEALRDDRGAPRPGPGEGRGGTEGGGSAGGTPPPGPRGDGPEHGPHHADPARVDVPGAGRRRPGPQREPGRVRRGAGGGRGGTEGEGSPAGPEAVRRRPRLRPVPRTAPFQPVPGGDREQRGRAAGHHGEGAGDTEQDVRRGSGVGRRGGWQLVRPLCRGGVPPRPPRPEEEARGTHVHPPGGDERGRVAGRPGLLRARDGPRVGVVPERHGQGQGRRDRPRYRPGQGERVRQGPSRPGLRVVERGGEHARHRRRRECHEGEPRDEGFGRRDGRRGDGGAPSAAASHGTLTPNDRSRLDAGMRAVEYLKRLRSMHMIPVSSAPSSESASSSAPPSSSVGSDMLSSLVARATNQATGLLAKATDRLGTMLGRAHKARATSVVENICEMRPGTEDDEYLYLDPRVKGDVDVSALRNAARAPAREAIAFVIGGGCYAEYQNIQSVAEGGGRPVTYGSTEIVDPCTFLGHLGGL